MKQSQPSTVGHALNQGTNAPADLQKIGQYMAKLKVQGLPRNYQLFHEALFGHDRQISVEIAALGLDPSQPMLDRIGLKYRLVSHCGLVADKSQTDAAQMLREVAEQLADGLQRKRGFVRAVETVSQSVAGEQDQSLATFVAEMDFLNTTLANLMLYETELTEKLQNGMERLETLGKGQAAMQVATLTDRITGLPNKIALNNRLAELYESDAGAAGTALILVDIDDFGAFNSKFGPQPANQMLKKLGGIFRKAIKKHDFVARMSGDDFGFLFPGVDAHGAVAIAKRLRASVEENLVYVTPEMGHSGKLTISVGIALGSDACSALQLMAHAEATLATAQSNRRQPLQLFSHEIRP
ncbi:diguanylate cyclase [Rhizobium sp. 2YAF20]|uniref:GGDEF domain-containing protein n=1 Tax=Rhizobium sp. 2YAF20 TaxID=3233027 RepID=UPI003F9C5B58